MKKVPWKYYLLALLVVFVDQLLKLWVHFNMEMGYGGAIKLVGNLFKLHYTLNPGMAFGIQFGFRYSKLLLTLGRIVATFVISYHMWQLWRDRNMSRGYLRGWALILGGAVGNVVDSTFYGVLLNNAPYNAPIRWFHGQVIDMFYLDIWETKIPAWMPFVGTSYLAVFPIFNLADLSILVGIALIFWARRNTMRVDKLTAAAEATTSAISRPTTPSESGENS